MFIVAIRVLALTLLVLGLWHLGGTLYQADQHFWHHFTAPVANLEPLTVNGIPVDDPQQHLTQQGCYGAAITVIGLGFAFIAWRL